MTPSRANVFRGFTCASSGGIARDDAAPPPLGWGMGAVLTEKDFGTGGGWACRSAAGIRGPGGM